MHTKVWNGAGTPTEDQLICLDFLGRLNLREQENQLLSLSGQRKINLERKRQLAHDIVEKDELLSYNWITNPHTRERLLRQKIEAQVAFDFIDDDGYITDPN